MALNRNSEFVFKGKNHEIILLLGTENNGTRYYMPSDCLINKKDAEYKAQYSDYVPIGVPEAAKMTLTIDTSAFTQETSIVAKWIRENSNPRIGGELDNDDWTIPNCWIVKVDGNIEFIGVQESAPTTKHTPRQAKYEIQLLSLYKFAAEKTIFGSYTGVTEDTFLDAKVYDYINKQNSLTDTSVSYNWITSWGRTRFMPLYNYFRAVWWRKFDKIVGEVTRSTENENATHNESYPVFYQQRNSSKPDTPIEFTDLKIISEIFVSENPDIAFSSLQGGFTKMLMDRYKNLWNYLIAETEGHAKRLRFSYRTAGVGNSYYVDRNIDFIFKNQVDAETISLSEIIESTDGDTIEEAENSYIESNNRLILNRDKDVKKTTIKVSSGSFAKNSYESTCVYGNSTSVLTDFVRETPISKYTVWSRMDNGHANIPCTQFVHIRDLGSPYGTEKIKVSDYCRIYYSDTGYIETDENSYTSPFIPPGTEHLNIDLYNQNVNQLQANGLVKLCNEINAEVICRKQMWLELTILNNTISTNDLGKEYVFDFHKLFKLNYFYEEITFGTRGVLVGIETNFVSGESKCKFFIRSDKWA